MELGKQENTVSQERITDWGAEVQRRLERSDDES